MYLKKIGLTLFCVMMLATNYVTSQTEKVMVFSKTEGFRHESIETGIIALIKLGKEHNFQVTATEDAAYFSTDTLKNYNAVIF